ncbi:hypothetical protein Tco_0206449 [Tanacetum coccineum]
MAAQKGRTSPEFYFSSIIEETCGTKVCEDQKQNMENTMLDLLKICQQKELYCIHINVEDLIESALNSKLLLINLNSQRLNKEEHEVKNIAEPTAKRQTRITSCLRISMLSSIVILSGESKVQRIENKAKMVENIPLTFQCEEHYFGSFVYPLLEETLAELASSREIIYRALFAEILSFHESKCGENMVYDVSVGPWKNPFSERGKDAYQTLPGDLLVLVDGKPESISDLRCLGRTWALSSVESNEDDSTSLTIKVKASKPIEFQDGCLLFL